MTCNFRVGQKVVCVDPVDDLKCGEIYTITVIGVGLDDDLVGVDRSFLRGAQFYSYRFRPLVTRKTDIGQFKAMLNYQPKVVVLS